MNLFQFDDYKSYLKERLAGMPKAGRGEVQRISKALRMHSTRLSHVFQGDEHLTLEQGLGLARYLGFNELETEYFMVLLQMEKAGTEELKAFFAIKKKDLRDRSQQVSERLASSRKLTEPERAIFYSNWYYSAIRLACSLQGPHNIDTLAHRFAIPRQKAADALEFLLATGLCEQDERGGLRMGTQSTHLEARSPLVSRLHANWRVKAMEKHPSLAIDRELAFTSPMSIEAKDIPAIREILLEAIEKAASHADTDKPDVLYCLNVDWFGFQSE